MGFFRFVGVNSGTALSAGEVLRAKWGPLSTEERQVLIQSKGEEVVERQVRKYESGLNQQYSGLDAQLNEGDCCETKAS